MTYSLLGYKWADPSSITWSFGEVAVSPSWTMSPFRGAISDEGMRGLVRVAFGMWETLAKVDFIEVPLGTGQSEPDVQIGFALFANPMQVDNAYSWQSGGEIEHLLVLLSSPGHSWQLDPSGNDFAYHKPDQPVAEGSSLLWTVVHEVGHVLGIDHSSDPGAAMAPVIGPYNMHFTAEDAVAVQALYGAPDGWVSPFPASAPSPPDAGVVAPLSIFDPGAYLRANSDVAVSGMDALSHHGSFSVGEGRDGAVWFDDGFYLARHRDVAASGMDPLVHYLLFGREEGRTIASAAGAAITEAGIDAQFYLMTNGDVAASGMDPLTHFRSFGWLEGRDPNAWFDVGGYLSHNRDVDAAGMDPLEHFHAFGWREGRDPSAGFDVDLYLASNPDVAAAGVDPLVHLMRLGLSEGRGPATDGPWL